MEGDPNYPGSETSANGNSEPEGKPPGEGEKTGETFLIPKSALKGDYKVGDTCTFKIVHEYSDELEVEDKGGSKPEPESMESAQGELDDVSMPA